MHDSKLHSIISSLNKFETNAFEKYLVSPFFNVDAKLQRFFPALLKFSSTDAAYTKEEVYKKGFAKQRYSDKEMRYLISSLSKHLENFIALRKFSNDSLLFNSTLAKELATWSMASNFAPRPEAKAISMTVAARPPSDFLSRLYGKDSMRHGYANISKYSRIGKISLQPGEGKFCWKMFQ